MRDANNSLRLLWLDGRGWALGYKSSNAGDQTCLTAQPAMAQRTSLETQTQTRTNMTLDDAYSEAKRFKCQGNRFGENVGGGCVPNWRQDE